MIIKTMFYSFSTGIVHMSDMSYIMSNLYAIHLHER